MLTQSTCNKDATSSGTAYIVINYNSTLCKSLELLEQRAEQVLMEVEAELIQYKLDLMEGLFHV